ncbi:hypothetical protein [Streptomyces massasporeus]|uniref:hypothetical protein n=1 Tax=Streptomyces massasporeus TaxID=67324 RepID=UPI003F4B2749
MERSLRAARVATYVCFVLCGTLLSTCVVQIPATGERTGISDATLGGLLVVLGLGAFVGMQVAGPLPVPCAPGPDRADRPETAADSH